MDCLKIAFTSQTIWSGCLLVFSVSSWSYVINELKDYEGKDRLQFNCMPKQTEYERQLCYGNYTSAMSPFLTPLDFARLSFGLSGVGWVLFTLNAGVMIGRIRKATNTERQRTFKKQLKCRFIVNICYQSVLLVVMIVLFCLYQKLKYPAEYSCNQVAVNITCNDLRYKEKSNLNGFIVGIFSGSIFLCVVTIIHVAVSRDEILDLFLGKLAPDHNSEENGPLLAPTTDGRQTSSPTDTVAVTATNGPQSNNQELPAAGTDQTTKAATLSSTTDGRQTSLATGSSTPTTSSDRGQTSSSTVTVTATDHEGPQSTVSSRDKPASTTNNQELPAAGTDHTTEANQQPTAGPTDTSGQPNPTGPASITSRPVQEEQGTVGNGHTSTGAERARQEETVSKQLVSEAVTENTLLLEKLSKMLDREIRIIKCWKHLAYILEVPDKIRKKWDMYTEHSPTEDLLSHVTNENPDLTVQQLKKKLETIFRNDVIEDLNKGGYKDEASVVELFAEDPKFNNILSRLDEKTMHNYKNLAKEFKINTLKIDQLGMRFSGGPTAFLFYYMSFTEGLKDLTIHQLRKHFEEMKLIKLAKVVTKATNEDSDLVKDVVVEGSHVLEEIADNLNHKKQSLKNWRDLAHKLGILRDVYESFDTSKEDSHSPTKIMFEWLQQAKPNLTVENLLDGLEQIERLDVKQEVTFALAKKKKQKSKNDSTQVYDTEKQAVHILWQMSHDTDQAKKEKHDLSAGLREKAATQGLRILDNDGKGNCMFSALCRQLEIKKGLEYSHVDLRTELVQYLRDHPDLNDFVDQEEYPTWDYYVEEMEKIGHWGDGVILLAAARHLHCVVRVISNRPDFPDVYLRPDGKGLVELVLGHIFQYHFVSLEPAH